jgi:hypothetical protein
MEQRPPWEVCSHSDNQEILRILWNPKVHYRVDKSPPLVPILSPMHPVRNFPPYFPKILSNIIFSSTPTSSVWTLAYRFPNKHLLRISRLCHKNYKQSENSLREKDGTAFNYHLFRADS